MPKRPEQTIEQPEKKELVALPIVFCRSSLFSTATEMDVWYEEKLIYSTGDWTISYTGHLLRQRDLEVWLACLSLLKKNGVKPGEALQTTRGKILKEMGVERPRGWQLKEIKTRLVRLMGGYVKVDGPVSIQRRHMLTKYDDLKDGGEGKIEIIIDPLFAPLIENYVVKSSLENTLKLKQSLSKWLYRFATTHEGEFSISVKKIRELSGNSEDIQYIDKKSKKLVQRLAKPYNEFRRALGDAIAEILETTPDEFRELKISDGGDGGEGLLVSHLSERPKVLINKDKSKTEQTRPRRKRTQNQHEQAPIRIPVL